MGDGQLQGDATAPHGRRPAGRGRSRLDGQDLSRQSNADWRSHRLRALAFSAGKRDGKLCKSRPAGSGAHRLHQPGKRRLESRTETWIVGRAEGASEVKKQLLAASF